MATPSSSPARVRSLTDVELDAYDVLPRELAVRVRLIRVPFLAGPYTGMTLGRRVLLRIDIPPDGNNRLLAHELVHVRQWAELGVIGFGVRYLGQFARGLIRTRNWDEAYRNIEAEVEARAVADRWWERRSGTGGPR